LVVNAIESNLINVTFNRAAIGVIIIGKKVINQSRSNFKMLNSFSKSDDDNDLTARKAFESVLRVSLLQPTSPKFHNFSEIVRRKAVKTYNYHFFEGEEVSAAACKYVRKI
jgi:hypothetical protein